MSVEDDDTRPLLPPGRGGLKAVRWNRFLRDAQAVRETAQTRSVVLGTQDPATLRKYGVGVPPLWPMALSPVLRRATLDIQAFQAMTRPPAACLWAAAATPERISASMHIEFVGDIARVSEAVDVQADGVGARYVLGVEPAASALARCLDTVGFGAAAAGPEQWTRLRAWYPFRWTDDAATAVPPEQMRSLTLRFAPVAQGSPDVTDQMREHCDDVAPLSTSPTRADVLAALTTFFSVPA